MMWKVNTAPQSLHPCNAPLPIEKEAAWPQSWSGQVGIIWASTEIRSPGLQSVVRLYTVYAIPAPGPTLSQTNSIHILAPSYFKLSHLSQIARPVAQSV